jgi:VPDSG-CTERM motif
MKTQKSILITAAIALLIAAGSARADTFFLTSDHCTGGCGTAPYGSVTLTQSGANVDVTVTLFAGYSFVKTGAGGFMAFLFDNSAITIANITNIQSSGGPTLTAVAGMPTIHADGTGDWMWGIACLSCAQGGAGAFTGPITFTVTSTTIAQMTVGHNVTGFGNELFVADVLAPNGNTGPVDANATGTVPDGGTTLLLLGTALSGLGLARRFFWR